MSEESLVYLAVILGIIAFVVWLGLTEKIRFRNRMRTLIAKDFGKYNDKEIPAERVSGITAYYRTHKEEATVDDITWSDLEMDRLFLAMNVTYSAAGEELLYHTLRTPLYDEDQLKERKAQIDHFLEDKDKREKLQLIFAEMGKNDRYSLYDYLEFAQSLKEDKTLPYHFLAPLLIVFCLAMMVFNIQLGIMLLIAVLVVNMSWYFRAKAKTQPYLTTMRVIERDIRAGNRIIKEKIEVSAQIRDNIEKNLEALIKFRAGALFAGYQGGNSGNPLSIIADYLNMILHIDLIAFSLMLLELQKQRAEIDELHTALGKIEVLIAAASWKKALEGRSCESVFDGAESAGEIWHPLLEDPVKNSYELKGPMLLTGSNASGKSTFLKTVAVNMLLSQCFGIACADVFHTGFHRIYTSMALRDDMSHGESYFMAEIKAMRRILEASSKEGRPIVCFVDEVLRGTNTVERIAASTQILKYMAKHNILCFAATHDIELTRLLDQEYANYHFEEEVSDGDVRFNYKLLDGRASTQNAILLLGVMGYDETIVKDARALSEFFMKEGRWQND